MSGTLFNLAQRIGETPLIFREGKDGLGFYTAGRDVPLNGSDLLKKKSVGVFFNFYPEEDWYKNEAKLISAPMEQKTLFNTEKEKLFPLFCAYKFSSMAKGSGYSINESVKKMIVSAAFLEADAARAQNRNDENVLIRRAVKTASYYYDYYYEGGIDKTDKGYFSGVFSDFMKNALELLSLNALQEDFFLV